MSYRKPRFQFNIGCIIKIVVLVAILVGILLIINVCTGGSCIKRIDKTLPDNNTAPWLISTPTHTYYAKDVTDDGETVIMSTWYEQVDGKWVKHSGNSPPLKRSAYGRIDVKRR